jgi:hypothetical protein
MPTTEASLLVRFLRFGSLDDNVLAAPWTRIGRDFRDRADRGPGDAAGTPEIRQSDDDRPVMRSTRGCDDDRVRPLLEVAEWCR